MITTVAQTFLMFAMVLVAVHLDKAAAHGFAILCMIVAVALFIVDGMLKR